MATTDGRVPGQRGRATRRRLLEATIDLLSSTPWRSVKVIDIARSVGTSPATFYQYFENVEQAISVLAEEMVEEAADVAELVDGDWSPQASWETALRVTEGFLAYWEANRAVFRVVDLATEEGDTQLRGVRVRALNAVTVALARSISVHAPGRRWAGRRHHEVARRGRSHGRRRHPGGHVRQCGRPPLRLRVLGHSYGGAVGQPGPAAALGGHRPAGTRRCGGTRAPADFASATVYLAGARWCRRLAPVPSTPRPRADRRVGDRPSRGLQSTAVGLSGLPSPPVKGSGEASSRKLQRPAA